MALFAIAATIGVIRIATGANEILAPVHRFALQAGGTFALVLIVSQIAKHLQWKPSILAILACGRCGIGRLRGRRLRL
ncbi:MAG: hypothetical protein IPL62_20100 [Caulobacteraceae bacterium]|nr:hypothetical protein [Caulobacteraceae bacterium]